MKLFVVIQGMALLAPLVVAACGGDDGVSAKPSAADDSPLAAIFGDQKSLAAEELLVQEKVRDCMVAQGFSYTPLDPTSNKGIQTIDLGSDDFVKQNGWGISTFVDGFAFAGATAAIADPNADYVSTLSESDKAAYQKALFGQIPTPDPDGKTVIRFDGNSGQGCLGTANKEVRSKRAFNDPTFQDKLTEMNDRVLADPRITAAKKAWSSCMAKSGYQYSDADAARAYIQRRTQEITGHDAGPGIGSFGTSGGGSVSIAIRSGGPGGEPAAKPTPSYDVGALKALQDEERKLALASLDCSKKSLIPAEQKVRREYEEAFVRDNPQFLPLNSGNPGK